MATQNNSSLWPGVVNEHHQQLRSLVDLTSAQERQGTFTDQWPTSLFSPYVMAKAGFFYLGARDKTCCFSCKLVTQKWDSAEHPLATHRNLSPNCEVVRNYRQALFTTDKRPSIGEISEQRSKYPSQHPVKPLLAATKVRKETFHSWPLESWLTSTNLTEAGFYSHQVRDRVSCFYCGIGLQNWQRGDGIWVEHARWRPSCEFLQRHKRAEFVTES